MKTKLPEIVEHYLRRTDGDIRTTVSFGSNMVEINFMQFFVFHTIYIFLLKTGCNHKTVDFNLTTSFVFYYYWKLLENPTKRNSSLIPSLFLSILIPKRSNHFHEAKLDLSFVWGSSLRKNPNPGKQLMDSDQYLIELSCIQHHSSRRVRSTSGWRAFSFVASLSSKPIQKAMKSRKFCQLCFERLWVVQLIDDSLRGCCLCSGVEFKDFVLCS